MYPIFFLKGITAYNFYGFKILFFFSFYKSPFKKKNV